MGTDSAGFHENAAELKAHTRDLHRALVSLQEELEAIDWYQQRVDAAEDQELKEVLQHNRDEEKEHAAMILEWLRRTDAAFERFLRLYLFRTGSITAIESQHEPPGEAVAVTDARGGWTVGSLIAHAAGLPDAARD
ncbi:MAG: encapsulin-associated ferritin-like protein [Acidiferrobacteraceae bacterium]